MNSNNNNTAPDKQRARISGEIKEIGDRLVRFDLHAATKIRPQRTAPAANDKTGHQGGDNDGMLGSLILDSLLGGLFSQAVALPAPFEQLGPDELLDAADEFWMDRRESRIRLGESGTLSHAARDIFQPVPQRTALPGSAPERRKLEALLARYQRHPAFAA